jgi:hypothetical protein
MIKIYPLRHVIFVKKNFGFLTKNNNTRRLKCSEKSVVNKNS